MQGKPEINLRVTTHATQGERDHMEDLYCVAYEPATADKDLLYAYFGVFDGHGGKEAAQYAQTHLMDEIVSQENFWAEDEETVLKAIKDGFLNTHNAMWKEFDKWPEHYSGLPSTAGTTASVAFIRRGKLYIGHVGDSLIALGYQDPTMSYWRAKPLTKVHKPEDEEENARITKSGGKVVTKCGVPRVVWNRPQIDHKRPFRRCASVPTEEIPFLAIARSLGDIWSYNPTKNEFAVSPIPDVAVFDIDTTRDKCLIFGTDGLWNMVGPQEAVNSVYLVHKNNQMLLQGIPPNVGVSQHKNWKSPSKTLVDRAIDRWKLRNLRADNTTVITVLISALDPPKAQVQTRKKRSGMVRRGALSAAVQPNSTGTDNYETGRPMPVNEQRSIPRQDVPAAPSPSLGDKKLITMDDDPQVVPAAAGQLVNIENEKRAARRQDVPAAPLASLGEKKLITKDDDPQVVPAAAGQLVNIENEKLAARRQDVPAVAAPSASLGDEKLPQLITVDDNDPHGTPAAKQLAIDKARVMLKRKSDVDIKRLHKLSRNSSATTYAAGPSTSSAWSTIATSAEQSFCSANVEADVQFREISSSGESKV